MAFALTAFAFIVPPPVRGSRSVLGKRLGPSLVSVLLQNRILALFATHVVRAGLVLTPPLSALDQGNGTKSAGNVFMALGPGTLIKLSDSRRDSSRASERWKILRHGEKVFLTFGDVTIAATMRKLRY
jgi:hypothetical protein